MYALQEIEYALQEKECVCALQETNVCFAGKGMTESFSFQNNPKI